MKLLKKSMAWAFAITMMVPSAWQPVVAEEAPAAAYENGVVVSANTDFPDVAVENQATFTFEAPANAAEVNLIGNFQYYDPADIEKFQNGEDVEVHLPYDYKPGMYNTGYVISGTGGYYAIPMAKEDKYWRVTLPLPSTEYCYKFQVIDNEGKKVEYKDPTNMPFVNIDSDSGWSLIWVGDKDSAIAGQEYIYPSEKQGKVEYITFTALDGTTQPLGVYLPYDYSASKTYKTLYLSHGGGGNEVEWFNIGAANNIFDNLIEEGLLEPTIIVTMDFSYLGFTSESGMKNLTDVIIPLIEKKYSVGLNGKDRAIAGLSAGGQAATTAMALAIDEFGYYGIWSPSKASVFSLDEGVPSATEEQLAALNKPEFYYVSVGSFDNDTRRTTEANLVNTIREHGGNAILEFANGAHDWGVWRQQLTTFAKDYLWEEIPGSNVIVNPNTDFPESDAPYQVTFTFVGDQYAKVDLIGGFQFYTDEQAAALQAGDESSPVSYDAYQYKEGMWPAGTDLSGIGNRPYPMEKIGNIWTITIPVPAGVWFYAFNAYLTEDGKAVKVLDPQSDTPYNEANDHDNGWSLITIGNSDQALPGQDWVFPEASEIGTTSFVTYQAIDGTQQPLGVYLPPNYDASKTYPVVYVSHGGGGNEVEWHFLGATDAIMNNLIEAGEVKETIVVTMDNTYFGWKYDLVGPNLTDCIIPFIEANYSVDKTAAGRAFCGLSMGGGVANNVFLHNADVFKYIGIWSGCYPNEDYSNVAHKDDPILMLGAGCIDMARPGFPLLMEKLDSIGVDYTYHEAHGAHDWSVWRELFTIFAKDYLWTEKTVGVQITANTDFPNVEVDNQATFTFKAPLDAVQVNLIGNFQYYDPADISRFQSGRDVTCYLPYDYKPGMYNTGYVVSGTGGYYPIPMENDGMFWTVTLPLPSTEYCYQFQVVDQEGKTTNYKDPTNMPFVNIDSDSGWSLIWVGDKDSAIAGQEYIYPAEKQGTVEYITFTTLEGKEQPLGVYLPYGYDSAKTYKTLYLSHGGGGNEVEWFNIGSANNIFDNLIEEGLLEPTIIVTMDFSYLGFTSDSGMKNLTDAIIPLIEEKYAVSKKAEDRAISGLSAGGQAATKAMAVAIDKFGYYGVWSPSAANVFSLGSDGKPTATVRQLRDLSKGIVYYVSVGAFDNDTRRTTEANLVGTIRDNGGYAAFDYANGAHDWGVWRQQLTNFAKDYLWKKAPNGGVTIVPNTSHPEWNADYLVTFTYVNMENKEVSAVELQGGFQFYKEDEVGNYQGSGDNTSIPCYDAYHYEDGMFSSSFSTQTGGQLPYPMEEIFKGVYQVTLPLPGNQYYYAYYVTYADGSTSGKKYDPCNMPHVAPSGSNSGWSLLLVGDPTNTQAGQEFIYAPEHPGTVEFRQYTAVDETLQWIGVYTPYDYDPAKTYKTIYVSHGGGGNEEEWFYIGAAGRIMDNLLSKGLTKDAIIVTMNNTYFGWNNEQCADNVVNHIIPFIETYYNVGKGRYDRAFCGLSAGSMQTNEMARLYPTEFGYFGAFSGGSRNMNVEDYNIEELQKDVYYLTAGRIDMAYNNTMGIASVDYMKFLDEAGIEYTFDLLNGGHDWYVWRESLTRFMRDILWSLDPEPEKFTGFKFEDGKYYWYEEDIKQGTMDDEKNIKDTQYNLTPRGREIYDPVSNAWYWLDAIYDGAVATNKEVWMPYIYQDEEPGSTDGKWVRYDKYGEMIKGWYANDNGVYYYDLITGAMYYGEHEINGKKYTFDPVTGIMQ